MKVTKATRSVVGPDGEPMDVLTLSYHCAVCGKFVRSEDIREEDAGKPTSDR